VVLPPGLSFLWLPPGFNAAEAAAYISWLREELGKRFGRSSPGLPPGFNAAEAAAYISWL
jgi:hypothetical protein